MSNKVKCPECEAGFRIVEEDGRRIQDACYHCGNTGFITPEEYYRDQIRWAAELLAADMVNSLKAARNSDPEGEGWDFCAAENGMSSYEYTQARWMEQASEVGEVLAKLNHEHPALVRALLKRLEVGEEGEVTTDPFVIQLPDPVDPAETILFESPMVFPPVVHSPLPYLVPSISELAASPPKPVDGIPVRRVLNDNPDEVPF